VSAASQPAKLTALPPPKGGKRKNRLAPIDDPEALWDVNQAAPFLKLSCGRLYAETAKGNESSIPFVKVGRFVRWRRQDLVAYIERHVVGGKGGAA
jgi:hypothetical protein